MKLRNKKTGEVIETDYELSVSVPDGGELYGNHTYTQINGYSSIKELAEEWEDYEEPKTFWAISWAGEPEEYDAKKTPQELKDMAKQIGNYFGTKEEAEKAVEKLKAWQRLQNKGFKFYGDIKYECLCGNGFNIPLRAEMPPEAYTDAEVSKDLDLLFGGEE